MIVDHLIPNLLEGDVTTIGALLALIVVISLLISQIQIHTSIQKKDSLSQINHRYDLWGFIRIKMFGIAEYEKDFEYRRFLIQDETKRMHLQNSAGHFVKGYNIALSCNTIEELGEVLRRDIDPKFQGFAHEGAAMALWILDWVTPWNRSRFQTFLEDTKVGEPHFYMAIVGAGWAMGRLPGLPGCFDVRQKACDPLYGLLAADGYGFHEGFFKPEASFVRHEVPKNLKPESLRAFDNGLGRCMWFYCCADIDQIKKTINLFPKERHPALFAGLGLATTYAGGVNEEEIRDLKAFAGDLARHMCQGSVFASKARLRAGNPVPHNKLAARVLCDMSLEEAAAVADHTLRECPENALDRYGMWQTKICNEF